MQVGLYVFDDLFTRVCNKQSDSVLRLHGLAVGKTHDLRSDL